MFVVFAVLLSFTLVSKAQEEVEKSEQTYIWSSTGFDRAPTYTEVIGSPYLFEDWRMGIVRLENGKNYDGLKVKFDQLTDQLVFIGDNKKAMDFSMAVKAFDIISFDLEGNKVVYSFINGFPPIDGATEKSFYQVFDPGTSPKIEFVKRVKKVVYERSVYSSAVKEKLIEERTYYYLLMNKRLFKIKLNQKELMKYMQDHKTELNDFVAKNKLTFKSDGDFAEAVKYYNSLN